MKYYMVHLHILYASYYFLQQEHISLQHHSSSPPPIIMSHKCYKTVLDMFIYTILLFVYMPNLYIFKNVHQCTYMKLKAFPSSNYYEIYHISPWQAEITDNNTQFINNYHTLFIRIPHQPNSSPNDLMCAILLVK